MAEHIIQNRAVSPDRFGDIAGCFCSAPETENRQRQLKRQGFLFFSCYCIVVDSKPQWQGHDLLLFKLE